jgi:nucleotide-binding universal stress UspA family protein
MSTTTGASHARGAAELPAVPTEHRAERILLATDGGPAADAAMRWVADRARAHTLDVTVLDVVDVPGIPGWEAGERHHAADLAVGAARDHLAWAAASAICTTEIAAGDPLDRIVTAAERADLLVLGTNRVAGSRHLVASFATKVACASACPSVVVPQGWKRTGGPIVAGVEGNGSDEAALRFAAHEAEVLHRDLVLVHAWQLPAVVAGAGVAELTMAELDVAAIQDAAGVRLEEVADGMRDRHPEVRIDPVLTEADPVTALTRAGSGASLVVVGTHGLTLLDRLLRRSVSTAVLERPTCPIAIVRPRSSGG